MPTQPPAREGQIVIKDVRNVLKLLIEDLYGGDPYLTIRELIQNAHDALVELPSIAHLERAITLTLGQSGEDRYIEVIDTGIGMSESGIEESLCVVGNTDKLIKARENPQIIGRFGIGFLSSFIVAERVEVVTRQRGSDTTWVWQTQDITHWVLAPSSNHQFETGTKVRLYFRGEYPPSVRPRIRDLQTLQGLTNAVRQFAYLLRFPVYVRMANDPRGQMVNAREVPWKSDIEAAEAFRVLFSRDKPVFIHRFEVSEGDYQAMGVLYFRDEAVLFRPAVQLYVKRILVDGQNQDLLPPYAPMINGFVECPNLSVDLARRTIPPFDPAYLWLQTAVHHEYQKAFVSFAKEQTDKFIALWQGMDNLFIARLLDAHVSEKDKPEQHARSFALAAARYFPFYLVDTVSGGLGRPLWKMIDELVKFYKESGRSIQDPRGRITIYYTDSKNPNEKEMLIERYKEIIDVSREGSAHDNLISLLHSLNDKFDDFVLEKVSASQFEQLGTERFEEWREFIRVVQTGVSFYGREHEVVVETFAPPQTPIVITDNAVDQDILGQYKQLLGDVGGRGADAANVSKRLIAMLDGMGKRGGIVTIHVNADNQMMKQLRDGVAVASTYEVARIGIQSITWRAVLDYYGWGSTRDMIAHDRQVTQDIISNLLATTKQLAESHQVERNLVSRVTELERESRELRGPNRGTLTEALIGFVEIVDATETIHTNPKGGPEQAIRLIQLLIEGMQEYISGFSTPISFNGNGLQFYIEEPRDQPLQRDNIQAALVGLPTIIQRLCARNSELNQLIRDTLTSAPKVRVALSFGKVFSGRIGPSQNILGVPVVEVMQICNNSDIYAKHNCDLIITQQAYDIGVDWKLWKAHSFAKLGDFKIEGFAMPVSVYGPDKHSM